MLSFRKELPLFRVWLLGGSKAAKRDWGGAAQKGRPIATSSVIGGDLLGRGSVYFRRRAGQPSNELPKKVGRKPAGPLAA
jgi:hypothetical protein